MQICVRDVQTKQEPAYENIAATNCKKTLQGVPTGLQAQFIEQKKGLQVLELA